MVAGLLSGFLVAFGNAKALLVSTAVPEQWWPGLVLSGALILVMLVWAHAGLRLTAAELGLTRRGVARAALAGCLTALALAVPALVALRAPFLITTDPIRYLPLVEVTTEALLLRALLFMPLDTAIPEELAFRGALYGWLRRHGGVRRAAVVSSAAFASWHLVIVATTVAMTNVPRDPASALLAATLALAGLFFGGMVLAWLRERTRSLVAPVTAHAAFNAALLVGLATA